MLTVYYQCGGGVPERTKGYFTSHLNAVSKILHGYHVQITARSDTDIEPANILQKVADASGSKYTAGGSAPMKSSAAPPPVKSKPVFPTNSSSSISFNPLVAARNAQLRSNNDGDGWGDDAPQVSRSQIERVESAYKPTKVDINALRSQGQPQDDRPEAVRGAYQPIGKVDIAAIRAAAKEKQEDRPGVVKGAYEPIGKVDIAAIRAKAQKPSAPAQDEASEQPKPVAERSSAFNQPERLTELPKPKTAKKFGGSSSSFGGTKPLNPGGFGLLGAAGGAPKDVQVGAAGRSFQAASGKTPAQLWAEKKAAQGGGASPGVSAPSASEPVIAQKSGGWQSGYSGKSWGNVNTGAYGRGIAGQKTGDTVNSQDGAEPGANPEGVSSLKDRFKGAAPIGVAAGVGAAAGAGIGAGFVHEDQEEEEEEPASPPPPPATRPSDAPSGGFALPGMPPRPPPVTDEDEEDEDPEPIRIAAPVARGPETKIEPAAEPQRSLPVRPLADEVPDEEDLPEEDEAYDPRAAAAAVAEHQFGKESVANAPAPTGGKRALIQYDYEKAEDNEVELREGEYVTNIEMVDDDWWMGTNSAGESGLFPSNYVELADDDDSEPAAAAGAPAPSSYAAEPEDEHAASGGATATASFDYEAAEDNGMFVKEF